jgi:choice-of-anchor B domain-containing protein
LVVNERRGFPAVTGGEVVCENSKAANFECGDVNIVSFLPITAIGGGRGTSVNDIWGWTDPQSGREYAIVGRTEGTSFVDITDPYNPNYLGDLPMTEGSRSSIWRDMKVYRDHVYIVADNALEHGMQVFDLTQLRTVQNVPVTFTATYLYDGINSAHNIVINEQTGYAYAVGSSGGGETCGGGLHMISLENPAQPTFAGCFADPTTGRRKTGYSHDAQCVIYHGPDTEHQGKEICMGSNETALSIADVTDKDNPVPLSMITYPNVAYTHQGWFSEDQRFFYQNDEGDEPQGLVEGTRTLVWDVTDLDDPVLVKEYIAETTTTDHNLYIRGDLMYQSNYGSGLRVLDISDPENPVEIGFFDTTPYGGMGSWSNYPYFPSGVIVATSGGEGLFVLKATKQPRLIP